MFVLLLFIFALGRMGSLAVGIEVLSSMALLSVRLMYCNEQWPPKIPRSKSLESMSVTLYGKIDFVFFWGGGGNEQPLLMF